MKGNRKRLKEIDERLETVETMLLSYINEFRTNYKDITRKLKEIGEKPK